MLFVSSLNTTCISSYSKLIGLKGAPELQPPTTPLEAARNGTTFYKELQSEDGHFATEYGGGPISSHTHICHLIII